MPKTNPIGVRFDESLLNAFKDAGMEITPQKALSIYEFHFKKYFSHNVSIIGPKEDILIYKLINPISNTIFYVGRTTFSLQKRLAGHIGQVSLKTTTEYINVEKIATIKEILNAGQKPIIELIETVHPTAEEEYRGYHEREIYWIREYLSENQPLTNKISNHMLATGKSKASSLTKVSLKKDVQYLPESENNHILARIAELENEIKSPPKNPLIGLKMWLQSRHSDIAKLKEQLNQLNQ